MYNELLDKRIYLNQIRCITGRCCTWLLITTRSKLVQPSNEHHRESDTRILINDFSHVTSKSQIDEFLCCWLYIRLYFSRSTFTSPMQYQDRSNFVATDTDIYRFMREKRFNLNSNSENHLNRWTYVFVVKSSSCDFSRDIIFDKILNII